MPKCYQLIGVPGSGKSTWVKNQDWASTCIVVSTDDYVERFAQRMKKTYSEVFDVVMSRSVRLMMRRVRWARERNLDIIWDQTSLTLASRRRKFSSLRHYTHIAVVFKTPEPEELTRRLNSRPGKTIPDHVMNGMIAGFDPVEIQEGFDEIWYTS